MQSASVVFNVVPAEESANDYFWFSRGKSNLSLRRGIGIFYLL